MMRPLAVSRRAWRNGLGGLTHSVDGLAMWRPAGLEAWTWLEAMVTTRHGGTSAPPYASLNLGLASGDDPERVQANRARLWSALGLRPEQVHHLAQVHGTRVWEVPDAASHEGDGLWTRSPQVVLAVSVADCVPLFLWDARQRWVALVHAGWRGTAAGVLGRALGTLLEQGARAADLHVALGPCIGPCCYAVSPDVAARFAPGTWRERGGVPHLDLRLANRLQADSLGVAVHGDDPPCTRCHPETFFSYRGEGQRSGRMWALAWRRAVP